MPWSAPSATGWRTLSKLHADSAQARELEERYQRVEVDPRLLEFFAREDAQVEQESAERREAANAASRARLKAALEQMEVICGYRELPESNSK